MHWFGDIDSILGYDIGEFPRTISGHMGNIHPDDVDYFSKAVQKSLKSGKQFGAEYRIRRKDGTYRYWNERGKPIEFDKRKAVKWVGSVTDITEQKTAELKLVESEHRYKVLAEEFNALLDAIPDNLILLSPDLKILWANKAFASHVGKKASGLMGQHCYSLCCSISHPCTNCPVIISFKSGKEETTRVMNTEGRIFDKRSFPIKGKSGEIRNVIEVTRDVTAKVHMEEEAKLVQSRLIHTNKMTSLGTLVSGVAHEINNPNSFILNNTQILAEIWGDAVKILADHYQHDKNLHLAGIAFPEVKKIAPKLLYGINDGSLRIKHIVDNLRNFSRPDKARMDGKVDINTIIMTSTSILENQIKKFTNKFEVRCKEDLPAAKGNAQQIEQVIINLIMNALQSLPHKKAGVSIHTKHNNKTNKIEIKIADQGCGISRKDLDRVTEPFFTTKFEIGGTGLGLSICDTIIRDHNGTLMIKSREGKGTVVTVKLPLYE
ncbi:MAG TPA: PAS domain-containing sensor histidine kinase [Nitrospiraceae bacterium]|nr:PAS domain-containing sensor histidine kinase [Nitrospiraceae bacterium]